MLDISRKNIGVNFKIIHPFFWGGDTYIQKPLSGDSPAVVRHGQPDIEKITGQEGFSASC